MQPSEAQNILNGFTYHVEDPYRIRPPKQVLEQKKAHCIEGAIAAAFLLHQFPPHLLHFLTNKMHGEYTIAHTIFFYQTQEGFSSVGWSRYPTLRGRSEFFPSSEDLALSYCRAYSDMGARVVRAAIVDLDALPTKINWRNTIGDITFINDMIPYFSRDMKLDI